VDSQAHGVQYRRIGSILLERGVITESQLEEALARQLETGQMLGEILVLVYGVSRLELADALTEQWAEVQEHATDPTGSAPPPSELTLPPQDLIAEGDLMTLLAEAQAARLELTARTDALSRRLESLETMVAGVTRALDDLRPREDEPVTVSPSPRRRRRSATGSRPAIAPGR
jgi:hypothetical protein